MSDQKNEDKAREYFGERVSNDAVTWNKLTQDTVYLNEQIGLMSDEADEYKDVLWENIKKKFEADAEDEDESDDDNGLAEQEGLDPGDGALEQKGEKAICKPAKNDKDSTLVNETVSKLNKGLQTERYVRCQAATTVHYGNGCLSRQCRAVTTVGGRTLSPPTKDELLKWFNQEQMAQLDANRIKQYYSRCHRHKKPVPFYLLEDAFEKAEDELERTMEKMRARVLTRDEQKRLLKLIELVGYNRHEDLVFLNEPADSAVVSLEEEKKALEDQLDSKAFQWEVGGEVPQLE